MSVVGSRLVMLPVLRAALPELQERPELLEEWAAALAREGYLRDLKPTKAHL